MSTGKHPSGGNSLNLIGKAAMQKSWGFTKCPQENVKVDGIYYIPAMKGQSHEDFARCGQPRAGDLLK